MVGDDLLISAVGDSNVGNGGGVVYQYDPLSGELVGAYLSPLSEERRFGSALATAGNTVFVGDPINVGRVYVFRAIPEPQGWVLLAIAGACLPFAARVKSFHRSG